MNDVTRMDESCPTYEPYFPPFLPRFDTQKWVISHLWINCVTRMDESCHTHEWVMSPWWVMSHVWTNHVTRMDLWSPIHGSVDPYFPPFSLAVIWVMPQIYGCITYEWVILHISMSTTYSWVMSHISISHVTHIHNLCRTCQWVRSHI